MARMAIATVLAGVALALAIFGMIGSTGMQAGHAGLAAGHFAGLSGSHMPGLVALGLSVAAVMISWKQRSYLVAGLLVAAGIAYIVHLAPFMGDHGSIAFPGPVVGLFIGHMIMGLGLAKGVGAARARLLQHSG